MTWRGEPVCTLSKKHCVREFSESPYPKTVDADHSPCGPFLVSCDPGRGGLVKNKKILKKTKLPHPDKQVRQSA